MGLFGEAGKDAIDRNFSRHEAVCGVLLSIMACDGEPTPPELEYFEAIVRRHPIFAGHSRQATRRVVREFAELRKHHSWEALAEAAARHLPPDASKTVFALAVDLVFSDGKVDTEEEYVVERIQRILSITMEEAKGIVGTLAVKNGVSLGKQAETVKQI